MAASKRSVTAASKPAKKSKAGAPKSLAQKLLLKPDQGVVLLFAPRDQAALFEDVRVLAGAKASTVCLVWVRNKKELAVRLPVVVEDLKASDRLWICYPKAGQLSTDLNRDILHALAAKAGLDAFRQIALDEVWSALAFKRLE